MIEIERSIIKELLACAKSYPVVTVVGPRQSGKTTLTKDTFPHKTYVNLEEPDIRNFAENDPRRFLEQYPDGAILDEIQYVPFLLSYIQAIIDTKEELGLYILTGSHQLSLNQGISQSLAGRTGVLQLLPLSLQELKQASLNYELDEQLIIGFYPRIYKLVAWAKKKFKKFGRSKTKAAKFLHKIAKREPRLFAHWRAGMTGEFI